MYETGKLDNVIREMNRCSISLLGIAEVRWTGCGHFTAASGELLIYSGGDTHSAGVALILSKQLKLNLLAYKAISDRMIYVPVKAKSFNVSLLQVYAPTLAASEEETDEFFMHQQQEINSLPSQDIVFVHGRRL